MTFWDDYWWLVLLIVVFLLLCFFFLRCYQFYHIDYRWEKKRHFPQWSNSGIITRDNYLLRTNYNFVTTSKIIVIGVHGIGGAKEDFYQTKKFLQHHKVSFLSFDQRNWGENSKWNYHTLGTTISDIEDIISVLVEKYPNQKIFLLGEGFGSALVALALKRLENQIAGAVLMNFTTKNQVFKLTISSFFKIIFGWLFYKNILLPINFEVEKFSDSLKYIEKVHERNYRKNNRFFTLLYLIQAKKITKAVVKNINASACSVLVIQSGEDILADYDQVQQNEKKWKKAVTYKFYQKGKHVILNDSCTDLVLTDVHDWLAQIIKKW